MHACTSPGLPAEMYRVRARTNPLCRQIDWDDNPEFVRAWKEGRTGYPWIDAAMTQLREQGWIHHLARHAVACFLTRGDLYQSWEVGAKVFDLCAESAS